MCYAQKMKYFNLFSIAVVIFLLNTSLTFGYNYSDVDRLLEDKLLNYNRKIRPLNNQSEAMTVYVAFELVTIIELDEVLERISVVGVMHMYWIDELMAWDPKKYGGANYIFTESEDFWTPNLILVNTYEKIEKLGEKWTIVRFYADGTALYTPGQIFSASCSVDITFFPWDVQTCVFSFTPFGLTELELKMVNLDEHVRLNYFSPNGVWDFVTSSANTSYVYAEFSVTVKRKPQFTIVNVILPVMIMSFLNIVVFWIPTESGEKISYCLTVLLSIAVFLTLVGDNLPKTSKPMAILSFYLLAILVLSVCVTFSTIFSLRLYFRDEKRNVSAFWTCVVRFVQFDWCCGRSKDRQHFVRAKYRKHSFNISESQTHLNNHLTVENSTVILDTKSQMKGLSDNSTIQSNNQNINDKRHSYNRHNSLIESMSENESFKGDVRKTTWKEVSVAVDMLCFVFYTLLLMSLTTVFVLVSSRTI